VNLDNELDLQINRLIKAPRALVWKAWTDPQHLKEWWCPKPWTTEVLDFELRPSGAFHTLMRGPGGESSDNPGSFLEIVTGSRIAFTSALVRDWRPAPNAWMPFTAIITLDDEGSGTRYVATVLHKDKETRDQHEKMGFYDGWGTVITQLEAYASALA
jgi:uncharacterized protein YndB with AHSA1/START domain